MIQNDKAFLRNPEFYLNIAVSVFLAFLFVTGIGSYRLTLVLVIFFSVRAFFVTEDNKVIFKTLIIPLTAVTLVFDLKYGELFTFHHYGGILSTITAFLLISYALNNFVNTLAEKYSEGWVFSWCPSCKFENKGITLNCNNCGYAKKRGDETGKAQNRENLFADSFAFINPHFRKYPPPNALENLQLDEDEVIRASFKVPFICGIYINGNKDLCDFIIVTNKNLIFLKMLWFHRGWRLRDKIALTNIDNCCAAKKKIGPKERKAVRFAANGIIYEFFLWVIDESDDEHRKCVQIFSEIISQYKDVQHALRP